MTEKVRWQASPIEPIKRLKWDPKAGAGYGALVDSLVGYRVRPLGTCRWCRNQTEACNDPYPDLCAMCQKAGRTSQNQVLM